MSYCIYLRKSRADRDNPMCTEAEVLSRHEQTLKDLAFNRGYKIDKIFREVVSGETLAARPQMQQLLSEVEGGMWEGVLVMEVERLARGNSIDQGIVAQAFKYSNTLIITPNKTYNPANEYDEEFFEFGLFMSRREYKTINRRLNAGRLASVKEGNYIGSIPPYGYKKVKLEGKKGYTLEPVPEEAEVVKLMFKLYTQDNRIGMARIRNTLNQMGIKPRNGDSWTIASIRDMLENDVYIGKVHWNKHKVIKSTANGSIQAKRPRQKEYDVFDGKHPPLIDEVTFNKAQYYKSLNPANPAQGTLQNPLAGILICSKCGKKMIRRPHSKCEDYVICPTVGCPNVGAPLEIVENRVIEGIKIWLNDYIVKTKNLKPELKIAENKPIIEQIDKNITKLNNQLTNTYDLLEQGIYTKELFLQRQKTLTDEINKLQTERERLTSEDDANRQKEELKQKLIPQVQKLVDVYYTFDEPSKKNKLLKSVFNKIYYTKDTRNSRISTVKDNFTLEFDAKLR